MNEWIDSGHIYEMEAFSIKFILQTNFFLFYHNDNECNTLSRKVILFFFDKRIEFGFIYNNRECFAI